MTNESSTGPLLPDDPEWSCLDSLGREPAVIDGLGTPMRLVHSIQVLSFLRRETIPSLQVRACEQLDVGCERPIVEVGPGNEAGWVDVPVTYGFRGYFEFISPTYLPFVLTYNQPLPSKAVGRYPMLLLDLEAVTAISAVLGIPYDAGSGGIMMVTFNCQSMPAEGVVLAHDRGGVPWYLVGSLPTPGARATSAQGVGGFLNVPPGISVVQTTRVDGTPLGPPQTVLVRPGWFTAVAIEPAAGSQAAAP